MTPRQRVATPYACAIAQGDISAEAAVRSCLARIDARERTIGAWQHLVRGRALADARTADRARRSGRSPLGLLHGVPVGLKDIFDTADMPTENGSRLHAGRRPKRDSAVAARLRAAGAILLGKTVTTEFATYQPGKTRHPRDPRHTPGGSSSGSAAAVAAGMVPLAVGSQTNGSVIRPASYCGVVGFKPTHGLISRAGMFQHQAALDHVGVFARSVEDAALLTDALAGPDPADPDTFVPAGSLLEASRAEPPAPPRLVALHLPWMDRLEPEAARVFERFVRSLGRGVVRRALPKRCARALRHHQVLHETGLALHLAREYASDAKHLSPKLRAMIEAGQRHSALAYAAALAAVPRLRKQLDHALADGDAFLVPAATGAAPRTRESTGDPVFSTLWTLCGLPAITLPLLEDRTGMPIGVQLVAPRFADGHLLALARWLMERRQQQSLSRK